MNRIDDQLIESLAEQAAASPRRRQHYNLHKNYFDPSQRLMNFLWYDSYICPHRHMADPKSETLIALRGTMGCIIFDNLGRIKECSQISAGGACSAVIIEPDEWHTVVALSETALLLETKAGPFDPEVAKELAPWAVPEGHPNAMLYLASLKNCFSQN